MDLRLPRVRGLLRGPRRVLATAAAVLVLAGAGTWTALASEEAPAVHVSDRALPMGGGVRLDTSYFTAGSGGRRPAVLLAHGFGGSKEDVRGQAEDLAREGYAVLTWSARASAGPPAGSASTTPRARSRTSPASSTGSPHAPRCGSTRRATPASAWPAAPTAARSPCSPPGTTTGSTPSPRRSPTGTSPTPSSRTASSRSCGRACSSTPAAAAPVSSPPCAGCTSASPSPGSPTPRPAPCSPRVLPRPSARASRSPPC